MKHGQLPKSAYPLRYAGKALTFGKASLRIIGFALTVTMLMVCVALAGCSFFMVWLFGTMEAPDDQAIAAMIMWTVSGFLSLIMAGGIALILWRLPLEGTQTSPHPYPHRTDTQRKS